MRERDLAKHEEDDSAESSSSSYEPAHPLPPEEVALYRPPGPAEATERDYADTVWCIRPAHARVGYAARHADALVLMAESLLAHGAATRSGGERQELIVHVDAEVLADGACPGRSELEDGPALASETARRLGCDAGVVRLIEDPEGMPFSVGRKTRSIPAAINRALRARDRGCRFPGCTARHFFEGHHVRHWAQGGETSLENLVQICTFHHRLVHEGRYGVKAEGPNEFTFTTPDGRVIEPVPGEVSAEASSDTPLEELNRLEGLDIDQETGVTLWDGTIMDYGMAVDGLLYHDDALILDGSRYPDHFPPSRDHPH